MFYSNLDYLAKLDDEFESELIIEDAVKDRPLVDLFCKKFSIKLIRVTPCWESERLEPMYFFNDNLGGYTREGLENCLGEISIP